MVWQYSNCVKENIGTVGWCGSILTVSKRILELLDGRPEVRHYWCCSGLTQMSYFITVGGLTSGGWLGIIQTEQKLRHCRGTGATKKRRGNENKE
jgi:hypothetical protein